VETIDLYTKTASLNYLEDSSCWERRRFPSQVLMHAAHYTLVL